jgi:hypothetical protein
VRSRGIIDSHVMKWYPRNGSPSVLRYDLKPLACLVLDQMKDRNRNEHAGFALSGSLSHQQDTQDTTIEYKNWKDAVLPTWYVARAGESSWTLKRRHTQRYCACPASFVVSLFYTSSFRQPIYYTVHNGDTPRPYLSLSPILLPFPLAIPPSLPNL